MAQDKSYNHRISAIVSKWYSFPNHCMTSGSGGSMIAECYWSQGSLHIRQYSKTITVKPFRINWIPTGWTSWWNLVKYPRTFWFPFQIIWEHSARILFFITIIWYFCNNLTCICESLLVFKLKSFSHSETDVDCILD